MPSRSLRSTTLFRSLTVWATVATAATLALTAPRAAMAQTVGTIVIAHGGDSLWNATVQQLSLIHI